MENTGEEIKFALFCDPTPPEQTKTGRFQQVVCLRPVCELATRTQ